MQRFVKLLDDFPHSVVIESGLAPRTSFDFKTRKGSTSRRGRQSTTQGLIDDLLEWTPRLSGFGTQFGRNIIVESKSGSHILMLPRKHHDVKITGSTACLRAADRGFRGARRSATARTRIADLKGIVE